MLLFAGHNTEPAVHTLADHLEAVLARADALVASRHAMPRLAGLPADDVVEELARLRRFVDHLQTIEMALAARLAKARSWAELVGRTDRRLARFCMLFTGGTEPFVRLLQDYADPAETEFRDASHSLGFLVSRGLVPEHATNLDRVDEIVIDGAYLVGGVLPLADLVEVCESFLTGLDSFYHLFEPDELDQLAVGEPVFTRFDTGAAVGEQRLHAELRSERNVEPLSLERETEVSAHADAAVTGSHETAGAHTPMAARATEAEPGPLDPVTAADTGAAPAEETGTDDTQIVDLTPHVLAQAAALAETAEPVEAPASSNEASMTQPDRIGDEDAASDAAALVERTEPQEGKTRSDPGLVPAPAAKAASEQAQPSPGEPSAQARSVQPLAETAGAPVATLEPEKQQPSPPAVGSAQPAEAQATPQPEQAASSGAQAAQALSEPAEPAEPARSSEAVAAAPPAPQPPASTTDTSEAVEPPALADNAAAVVPDDPQSPQSAVEARSDGGSAAATSPPACADAATTAASDSPPALEPSSDVKDGPADTQHESVKKITSGDQVAQRTRRSLMQKLAQRAKQGGG